MPRRRPRKIVLDYLLHQIQKRRKLADDRELFSDESSIEDMELHTLEAAYQSIKSRRYLSTRTYRSRNHYNLKEVLDPKGTRMNAEEFLYNYRLTRESFALFLDKIKDHPVFKKKSNASKKSGNKKTAGGAMRLVIVQKKIDSFPLMLKRDNA